MFNFPDEKYTGKPIHSQEWEGPGFYACGRDFPGQETYTEFRVGPLSMSYEDREYFYRLHGSIRKYKSKAEFEGRHK